MRLGHEEPVAMVGDKLTAHCVAVFRTAMQRQGLSVEALAKRMGISGNAVRQVLYKRRNIGLTTLLRYASALGLSTEITFHPAGEASQSDSPTPRTLAHAVQDLLRLAASGDRGALRARCEDYLALALEAISPERARVRRRLPKLPVDNRLLELRREFDALLTPTFSGDQAKIEEAVNAFRWHLLDSLNPDLARELRSLEGLAI